MWLVLIIVVLVIFGHNQWDIWRRRPGITFMDIPMMSSPRTRTEPPSSGPTVT